MSENGTNEPKFLVDPYLEWVKSEGIPVHEDFGFDLLTLDVRPWARMGALGCYAHALGRGDFVNMYVCEIPPGKETAPQKHMFEEVVYVLAGSGSTVVETPAGPISFEWHTGSLFALPLNARYRHYNASGQVPARFVSTTDLPLIMNVFRNDRFIWDNDDVFPERFGDAQHYKGDGTFLPHVPLFAGIHVYKSDEQLAKALDEAGALLHRGRLLHSYPHSWRSKAPLIFRTTPQWFISMEINGLREVALKAIEATRFVPPQGKTRLASMIEQRPD